MAADYYRAMAGVEERLTMGQRPNATASICGQMLALIATLCTGTLNDAQRGAAQGLRSAMLALME